MSFSRSTASRSRRLRSAYEEAVRVASFIAVSSTATVAVTVSVVAITATAGLLLPRVLLDELVLVARITTFWWLTHT